MKKGLFIIVLVATWLAMILCLFGCNESVKKDNGGPLSFFTGYRPESRSTDPMQGVSRSVSNVSWLSLIAVAGGIFAYLSGNTRIGFSLGITGLAMFGICLGSAAFLKYHLIAMILLLILTGLGIWYALKTPGGINIKKLFGWEKIQEQSE